MPFQYRQLYPALCGLLLGLTLQVLPDGDSHAAPAMAVYRGDAPAASGPGRRIELRLKADGTMTWMTDYRNNKSPVIEEGRWNPISLEEIDLIIETRDGKPVTPSMVRLLKQGDVLRTSPESAAQFGSQGLQLRQAKAAVRPAAAPIAGGAPPVGIWRWEGLIAAADKLVVDQPERYTLEIQAGGKALVRADCNRGKALYVQEGRTMTFTLGAMTRAACPAGSLADRYLKALEEAVGQRTRGENLFLDLPAEGGSMKFVRAK